VFHHYLLKRRLIFAPHIARRGRGRQREDEELCS